jgi:hypothetical protein
MNRIQIEVFPHPTAGVLPATDAAVAVSKAYPDLDVRVGEPSAYWWGVVRTSRMSVDETSSARDWKRAGGRARKARRAVLAYHRHLGALVNGWAAV